MHVFKNEKARDAVYASYDKLVAAWDVGTVEKDLETSYGKTHVIMAGDSAKPPLLLFHGAGDNSAVMWVVNAKELVKHFRIFAIDTMGAAGRSVPDERYDKRFDLVRWYGDLLDGLSIAKAYAAGVSYGAYHCQALLINYPGRIAKIVCIAGYAAAEGYGGSKFGAMFRLLKFFIPAALAPTRKNILRAAARMAGPGAETFLKNSDIAEHFVLMLKSSSPRSQFNHNRRAFTREEIEAIREQALFLVGEADTVVNFPGARQVVADFNLNCRIIAGAGHAANHTKPREIEAEIVAFCLG